MKLSFGFQPGSTVTIEHDGQAQTVDRWGQAHRAWTGYAGRMNVYDDEIVSTPKGKTIRRKDGKTTLNLLDETSGGAIAVALSGDRKGLVETVERRQARGWARGDYYMLETDPVTGDLIVEPGRNHRKVHVTGGSHGYTKARIAAAAGVSEAMVTTAWLKARDWGTTPATAFAMELGFAFWGEITAYVGWLNEPHSHWLLLERGYDYRGHVWADNRNFFSGGTGGEHALHPVFVGAYGSGADPILPGLYTWDHPSTSAPWLAASGLDIQGGLGSQMKYSVLIADSKVVGKGINAHRYPAADPDDGGDLTLYRVGVFDASNDAPSQGTTWVPLQNHAQGIYASKLKSLLAWGVYFDHNGWRDGYSETSLDGTYPHPPSMYAHNFYIQNDNHDTCIDESILSRAASFGIQNRSGGVQSDNLFLDNQIASSDIGGAYDGAGYILQYGLYLGNVVTAAGGRKAPEQTGATDWGIIARGRQISLVDNIIAHKSDPNDPADIAKTTKAISATRNAVFNDQENGSMAHVYHDDTRIHRWSTAQDNAVALGLDQALLNRTTIQTHAARHDGFSGSTIPAYLTYLRGLAPRQWRKELQDALAFFRQSFGLHVPPRVTPAGCVFLPDPRGEGFRWDNRLNWSSGDIPGTVGGDRVDLDGNRVLFGRHTRTVAELAFGGGRLEVSSGKLTVQKHADAGQVEVRFCGQYFALGGAGVDYTVGGGRLCLTAAAQAGISVSGQAECLFGPALTIPAGKALTLDGGACWAGWDGTGTASLTVAGRLALVASGGRIGQLRRFKRNGDHPDPTVTATVILAGGSTVTVDRAGLAAGSYDLTGPGVTVVSRGAILPAGVTITGGKLVLVVS